MDTFSPRDPGAQRPLVPGLVPGLVSGLVALYEVAFNVLCISG